ncbi:MAG TPA: MarR family transcriptional regulator [Planctomycetes bacterium]|nr:MarR family transcriptional regulator [Planctomycetota bacterium]
MPTKSISTIAGTIAEECIAVRMRILNRAVTRIYDDALRPLGLRVTQMNILVAAGKMGIAHPAPMCRNLRLDGSTLSRNVERMKSKGWLETVSTADGRAQPFQLTRQGKDLLRSAQTPWRRAQKRARALLGDGFIEVLERTVERVRRDAEG